MKVDLGIKYPITTDVVIDLCASQQPTTRS